MMDGRTSRQSDNGGTCPLLNCFLLIRRGDMKPLINEKCGFAGIYTIDGKTGK